MNGTKCTSNSIFLQIVIENSPQLIKVYDLKCCHGIIPTKRNYAWRHTWSKLKAQPLLLLNNAFSTTSWIFFFQSKMNLRWRFGASCGVRGKKDHQMLAFEDAHWYCKTPASRNLIFFHVLLTRSCTSKWSHWRRIWLSISIQFNLYCINSGNWYTGALLLQDNQYNTIQFRKNTHTRHYDYALWQHTSWRPAGGCAEPVSHQSAELIIYRWDSTNR